MKSAKHAPRTLSAKKDASLSVLMDITEMGVIAFPANILAVNVIAQIPAQNASNHLNKFWLDPKKCACAHVTLLK